MKLQRTFKESYINTLKDNVKSKDSISFYSNESFDFDSSKTKRLANVYAPEGLADYLINNFNNDLKCGIAVYEGFKDISPLLASNEAFWTYLTHVDFFKYSQKRWNKVLQKGCSSSYIIDHWFVGPQGLLRNAIASLWWSVNNTIDESRKDKYELTNILFKNYTLRVVTFGSYSLIRHKEAMIGILSFLHDNPTITEQSFELSGNFICKYFNRLGAVKQLAYLKRDYFYNKCDNIKDKILQITSRKQLEDESLYIDTAE